MTYTGQSVRRFEDHRLLTRHSSYVDDLKLPCLSHAVVLRSPHAIVDQGVVFKDTITVAAMLIASAADVRTGLAGNPPCAMRAAIPSSMLSV